MYCKNCGSPIAEGTEVCPACGYGKQEATAEEANANVQAEEAVASENVFEEPSFEPEKKAGKGKKKIIIAAIACIAAIAVVLTTILNFDALKGIAIRTFGSDADYYGYVEKMAWEDAKETLVNSYGELKNNSGSQSVKGTIGFNVGEDASSLLSFGVDNDIFELIDNTSINFDLAQKDTLGQIKLALNVSENSILNFDAITDLANGKAYLGVPDMLEGYLTNTINIVKEQMLAYDKAFWDAMPDEDVVEKLIDRYFDLVIDSITQVEKTDGEIKVGDITQECSIVKFEISPEFVLGVAEKVLTELKADKDVEKIINDLNEFLVNEKLVDADEKFYVEYTDAIEEALKSIKNEKEELADEESVVVLTYINSKHAVIGREITLANEVRFLNKTARDGEKFATEIALSDMCEITGNGTQKGDLINGEYQITIAGSDMLEVTLKDFNAEDAIKGEISGTVKISGTNDLWKNMGLNAPVSSLIKLYDPAIELVVNNTEDARDVQINLLGKDKVLFGISFNTQNSKLPSITIPDVTVDGENPQAIQDWLNDFNLDSVKDKLEDAGVSSDIVDGLFGILESKLQEASADDFGTEYSDVESLLEWY